MKNRFKEFLRKLLSIYWTKSYSQEGEDLLLKKLLNKTKGRYIDIGAHHPKRFSNTYFFYKRGWSGVNVDANPLSIELFNRQRVRDQNIHVGIGLKESELSFYRFEEGAFNTFEGGRLEELKTQSKFIGTEMVSVIPLSTLIDKFNISGQFDFMSVDVEGFDLEVLSSNDWNRLRPTFIVVEENLENLESIESSQIWQFLNGHDYQLFSKLHRSSIYKDKRSSSVS
ncbi:FkbM family methyltransferase [Marinoscillum sp.]|uniref:FkbM family methyltransferase n=1 Tax=Marinoscillum sp. TaxID=2024838 RepID=UPI003BA9DA91